MKYIEEISAGDLFIIDNQRYVLSSDYKMASKDKVKKMAVSINDGSVRWFGSSEIVEIESLYYRDSDGNILLVKEYKNDYPTDQNFL